MTKDRLAYLYKKYIDGACTPAELDELRSFLADYKHESRFRKLLDHTWSELNTEELTDLKPEKAARLIEQVTAHPRGRSRRRFFLRAAAAVAIAIVLSAGLFLYLGPGTGEPWQAGELATAPEVKPGSNKATLKLADGRSVSLSSDHRGVVVRGAELVYEDGSRVLKKQESGLTDYAVLATPKGGQYQLVLSDGTRVWLNAGSSLKYPVRFAGGKREVELTGEGYFEVTKKGSASFQVKTALQVVEVLGTRFNISAYEDDGFVKTTLAEGSVQVSQPAGQRDSAVTLRPGWEAEATSGVPEIRVGKADLSEALAWKDGLFIFDNEPVRSMMKRLSRWYDVAVEYRGNMDEIRFSGNYFRYKGLKNLLKNLEATGKVSIKIKDEGTGEQKKVIISAG